jgi:chromosome partitioning protein
MSKTITICQRKGGVAKSTCSLNLACVLAEAGWRVLIVDLDDQQNTTTTLSACVESGSTVADLLLNDETDIASVITATDWPNVWMLPASANLSAAAKHLDSEVGGHLVLGEKLKMITGIDYIIIDTSPALNILVINALCASDYLFIPLSSKFFSLQGLAKTLAAYTKVKQRLHPGLELLGMAFVIHDGRSTLAAEIVERVQTQYPNYLFKTIVGINIRIEEAQVKKQSILTYAPDDRGAEQYRSLGREMLERIGNMTRCEATAAGAEYAQTSIR